MLKNIFLFACCLGLALSLSFCDQPEKPESMEEDFVRVPTAPGEKIGDTRVFDLGNNVKLELVWIPGGKFQMGSRLTPKQVVKSFGGEESMFIHDRPVHTVQLDGFWMGKCEVTNSQYLCFDHDFSNPDFKGHSINLADQPTVKMSWSEANDFCKWLTKKTGEKFQLPSEAQWEYACRAGSTTIWNWGDEAKENQMGQYENVYDLTYFKALPSKYPPFNFVDGFIVSAPVGSFKPNAFGLHDMIGNVAEWCNDWYEADYYSKSPINNPTGPQKAKDGTSRVLRGGSFSSVKWNCLIGRHNYSVSSFTHEAIGFRVVLPVTDVVTSEE